MSAARSSPCAARRVPAGIESCARTAMQTRRGRRTEDFKKPERSMNSSAGSRGAERAGFFKGSGDRLVPRPRLNGRMAERSLFSSALGAFGLAHDVECRLVIAMPDCRRRFTVVGADPVTLKSGQSFFLDASGSTDPTAASGFSRSSLPRAAPSRNRSCPRPCSSSRTSRTKATRY